MGSDAAVGARAASADTVPADTLAADVALAWDSISIVIVHAQAGDQAGLARTRNLELSGHCAPSLTVLFAAMPRHQRLVDHDYDHGRFAQRLLDGCPGPVRDDSMTLDSPGHAAEYQVA